METNQRQKWLIILAVGAISILILDRAILSPLMRSWKERGEMIVQLRKAVAQGTSTIERDQTTRSRWEEMRTNTLPTSVSVAESVVLKAFDRWAQDSRVSVSSIKPQWKRGGDDYVTLECRADATGSMAAISRFLFELEKDPLAIKVESVEITARDNSGEQLSLGLQVSGLQLNSQQQ